MTIESQYPHLYNRGGGDLSAPKFPKRKAIDNSSWGLNLNTLIFRRIAKVHMLAPSPDKEAEAAQNWGVPYSLKASMIFKMAF